jgi:hypothetical protein
MEIFLEKEVAVMSREKDRVQWKERVYMAIDCVMFLYCFAFGWFVVDGWVAVWPYTTIFCEDPPTKY